MCECLLYEGLSDERGGSRKQDRAWFSAASARGHHRVKLMKHRLLDPV